MVQVGRVVTGAVFLVLFAGFELHIPAITNLIPGSYAGLPYTGYVGFGFLIAGISGLASGLSTPSRPSYAAMGRGTPAGTSDPATMVAAMMAMQQAQQAQAPGGGGGSVLCSSCGKFSLAGAKFCQNCAAPLTPGPNPTSPPAPDQAKTS